MRRNWFHSLVCVWTAAAVATGGCRTPQQVAPQKPIVTPGAAKPPAPLAGGRPTVAFATDDSNGTLTATLAAAQLVSTGATVTDLSTAETEALLARMEPLPDVSTAPAPPL